MLRWVPDARLKVSRMEAHRPPWRNIHCYRPRMAEGPRTLDGPEQMRSAMADYVRALHRAYLDAGASLPPGDRARLPLLQAQSLTVAAVGTRYLHVIGTTDALPAPVGPEIGIADRIDDIDWTLRFFDPVVAPGLGLIDETESPASDQVRHTLGIRTVVYHLTVPPGSGLTPHHALHAGTGLAHSHAAADRDYSTLAGLRPTSGPLIAEMHAAYVNQLPRAHLLLARELLGGEGISAPADDLDAVRREALQAIRGGTS